MTLLRKFKAALQSPRRRAGTTSYVDITHCDSVGLDEALGGALAVCRTRLLAGGGYIHPRRMLWPSGIEEAERPHKGGAKIPDIDLFVVADAVVGGHGSHLKVGDQLVFAEGPYPDYIKFWFDQQITPEQWDVTTPATSELERAFVIAHFNFVWGHWLTEIYPKLFLIEALGKIGVTAPILLPSTAPSYVARIIGETLPGQEIVVYDPFREAVRVRRALLPHMLNRHYVFHDLLRQGLNRVALEALPAGGPSRLFVSRRELGDGQSYRRMVNEDEIQGVAEDLGFVSISPERLSWSQQIAAFANASVVVGEFGSGLHNTLFSFPYTKVVAVNWIVDVQSRIASFKQQDIGYVLPSDGVPRTHTLEGGVQEYLVDPSAFREKVLLALDAADRAPLRGFEDVPTG